MRLLDAIELVDAKEADLDAIDLVGVCAVIPEARDSGILKRCLRIIVARSTIVKRMVIG